MSTATLTSCSTNLIAVAPALTVSSYIPGNTDLQACTPACTLMRVPCLYSDRPACTVSRRSPRGSRLCSGSQHILLQHPLGTTTAPAIVPCAHMEGADDILTPEEGLNEEPGALSTRVSLQEVCAAA
jgi:hypothetical protein